MMTGSALGDYAAHSLGCAFLVAAALIASALVIGFAVGAWVS